jgi:Cysteine-rich CPXCG
VLFQQEAFIDCPYCGESIAVLVDDSSGEQSYYEDCSVCCAPILFLLTEDEFGNSHIDVKRDDD